MGLGQGLSVHLSYPGGGAVGTTISQCSSTGDIVTESCVGGIVGRMLYSIVTQCYSSGLAQAFPMKVANPAGGIAGFVDPSPTAVISYCYSDCEISAPIRFVPTH